MHPKAASIPEDIMLTNLFLAPSQGKMVGALLRSEAWDELDSRNAQFVFLDAFGGIDCVIPLDSDHLAGVFDFTCDRVRRVLTKSKTPSRPPHPRLTLTHDQEHILCIFVCHGCHVEILFPRERCLDLLKNLPKNSDVRMVVFVLVKTFPRREACGRFTTRIFLSSKTSPIPVRLH
jgi:hypothetical protein